MKRWALLLGILVGLWAAPEPADALLNCWNAGAPIRSQEQLQCTIEDTDAPGANTPLVKVNKNVGALHVKSATGDGLVDVEVCWDPNGFVCESVGSVAGSDAAGQSFYVRDLWVRLTVATAAGENATYWLSASSDQAGGGAGGFYAERAIPSGSSASTLWYLERGITAKQLTCYTASGTANIHLISRPDPTAGSTIHTASALTATTTGAPTASFSVPVVGQGSWVGVQEAAAGNVGTDVVCSLWAR